MKREILDTKSKVPSQTKEQQAEEELRRGPWTIEEDTLLIHYVACHGEGRWNLLSKSAGLRRTGKSCRLRWLNYLKPDIKRGNLSPQEQLLILELHSKWGNRWSKIAAHLPGRTDNEIKNYWRTRVQKQARQLNMESNSQSFIDAIRCFYMPRLVQKIEQNSTDFKALNSEGSYASHMVPITSKLGDTSSSNTSLSSIPEFPDQPTSTSPYSPACGKTVNSKESSLVLDDCYCVDSSNCDVDMAAISPSNMAISDCHVAGHYWLGDDAAGDGMWGLGELW